MIDYKKYLNFANKTILPETRVNKLMQKISKKIKNYGMIVKRERFKPFGKYCKIPNNLAIVMR